MTTILAPCPRCGTTNRIPAVKQHLSPRCGRCHTGLDLRSQAVPVPLDDSDFAAFVAAAPLPVLVELYSPTCGPCHTLAPVIAVLARRYFGRLIVAKVDVSRARATAARFDVRGVPTLVFLAGGRVVDEVAGAVSEAALADWVERQLARR
ncbi:MAG: thioredoxin domain-containing protein [Thermodesulfobacteriota bacterium]